MTHAQWRAAVTKFEGWMEGGIARFPSVHLKNEFLKYVVANGG